MSRFYNVFPEFLNSACGFSTSLKYILLSNAYNTTSSLAYLATIVSHRLSKLAHHLLSSAQFQEKLSFQTYTNSISSFG